MISTPGKGLLGLSLGFQALLAAIFGIFIGLLFGPLCNLLRPVADVYIMLLQMVALPYICFSLMHGLGSMAPSIGRKLLKKGWIFWLFLWSLIFSVIYLLNFLIPRRLVVFLATANMTNNELIERNLLSYIVPENPIYDLANNIVPSIAIFGLIIGAALMHLEKKEPILSILERSNQIMEKILYWLAIVSPVGIFAHIAVAMGTVYFEDLYLLQFYVVSFIFVTLIFTLWILPAILSSLTPLSFKESLRAFQFVCLLPFATALPTIGLPFIAIYMKKLGQKHAKGDSHFHATSQTVMPLCYSFGQIGNSLILFFILFMSYFFRHPLLASQKVLLSLLTIPLSFGSSATSLNAVSFLTKQLNFPQATIDLFSETTSITLNFQVLLSIASVLTLIILVLYSYYGLLKVQWGKLLFHLIVVFTVLVIAIFSIKQVLPLKDNFEHKYDNLTIEEVIGNPVNSRILSAADFGSSREPSVELNEPLASILKTGVLKVGFDTRMIPFCYYNRTKELVGYDIAYAYELARDLDCTLEFIPISLETMGEDLSRGLYDLAMSAIIMNEQRLKRMDFSSPYDEENNVLIVPSKERRKYIDLKQVQNNSSLKIGAIGGYKLVVQRHFPLATLVPETSIDELIQGGVDAWMWSRSSAFVWCVNNPSFVVADYQGLIGKRYFAYPIRSGAVDWNLFLNNWLILKEQSGFKDKMYRYWINAESVKRRPPRWSILRNMFRWQFQDDSTD